MRGGGEGSEGARTTSSRPAGTPARWALVYGPTQRAAGREAGPRVEPLRGAGRYGPLRRICKKGRVRGPAIG